MSVRNFDEGRTNTLGSSDLLGKQVKRMTIEVPQELHLRLKQAAASEDRYIRDLVVDACRDYLKAKGHT